MILAILIAVFLFNTTWLIDTFLTKKLHSEQKTGKINNKIWTLMIIGGTIAIFVSIILLPFVIKSLNFNTSSIILLVAWWFYWIAALPYFYAFSHEKIENMIPIMQTIPIFSYIWAVFILNEHFSTTKVVLIIAIVIITTLFWRNFKTKKLNYKGILLILWSAILYSLSFVFFKLWWWQELSIRHAFFREHIWVALVSIIRILNRKTRVSTFKYFNKNNVSFSLLNIWNEIFYIIWIMIINYLLLFHPVAFINTISNGIQPILLFIMVRLAYKLLPNIFERNYTKKEIIFKISLCIILLLLLWLFFYS